MACAALIVNDVEGVDGEDLDHCGVQLNDGGVLTRLRKGSRCERRRRFRRHLLSAEADLDTGVTTACYLGRYLYRMETLLHQICVTFVVLYVQDVLELGDKPVTLAAVEHEWRGLVTSASSLH